MFFTPWNGHCIAPTGETMAAKEMDSKITIAMVQTWGCWVRGWVRSSVLLLLKWDVREERVQEELVKESELKEIPETEVVDFEKRVNKKKMKWSRLKDEGRK